MKILVTAFIYLGEDAGTTHIIEVWKHLATRHEVTILLPSAEKNAAKYYRGLMGRGRIRFVHGTARSKVPIWRLIKVACASVWYEIYTWINILRGHYDQIYVRSRFLNFAPLLYPILNKRYIVEVNGLTKYGAIRAGQASPRVKLFIIFHCFIERQVIKQATRVITVTQRLSVVIQQEYGSRSIAVIPNGADVDHFRPILDARSKIGLDADRVWIGFVGLLAPWQGIDCLIKSLAKISPEMKVSAIIIGSGPMLKTWQQLAKSLKLEDCCRFVGQLPYKQVPLYLNACDILVAPFTAKRNVEIGISPLKLFEYMACGKPIIVSDIPDVNAIVTDHQLGVVYRPEDPADLAQKIMLLINRRSEWATMSKNGRKLAVNKYSWAKTAEEVEKIIKTAT